MKRLGCVLALSLAAVTASAQMRNYQRGPGAAPGRQPAAQSGRSYTPTNPYGTTVYQGYPFTGPGTAYPATGLGSANGVRTGNWTFQTYPVHRPRPCAVPGFNCYNYGDNGRYTPVIAIPVPYYATYGYSPIDMQAEQQQQQLAQQQQALQQQQQALQQQQAQVAADSAYNAGYAAALQATTAAEAHAAPAETVITGAAPAGSAAPKSSPSAAEAAPLTIIVFNDGHSIEVRNYAIVGQTLWDLGEQRARKYPLSEIDLDATVKANDDRGIVFRVPGMK